MAFCLKKRRLFFVSCISLTAIFLCNSGIADEKCGFESDNQQAGAILMCFEEATTDNWVVNFYYKETNASSSWTDWTEKTMLYPCANKSSMTKKYKKSGKEYYVYIHRNLERSFNTTSTGVIVSQHGNPLVGVLLCGSYTVPGALYGDKVCNKDYICWACPGDLERDPNDLNKCKCPEGQKLKAGSKEECVEKGGGGGSVDPIEPEKPAEEPGEIKHGVECKKDSKDLYLFEPNYPSHGDSTLWVCENKKWIESEMWAWCCNSKCTEPKGSGLIDAGVWTTETGHHLYSTPSAQRDGGSAYIFYPGIDKATNKQNCTVCPSGTKYNSKENKCK